jgi:hypothetical protein
VAGWAGGMDDLGIRTRRTGQRRVRMRGGPPPVPVISNRLGRKTHKEESMLSIKAAISAGVPRREQSSSLAFRSTGSARLRVDLGVSNQILRNWIKRPMLTPASVRGLTTNERGAQTRFFFA